VAGGFVWEESKLTGFHIGPLGICFIYMSADAVEIIQELYNRINLYLLLT
jgi:hypothetical protein